MRRDSSSELAADEAAAARLLQRAVDMDTAQRRLEALACYGEGIGVLMDALRNVDDAARKAALRERVRQYMERAERLKALVEQDKRTGQFHEQIRVPAGGCGYSYERVFGVLLDDRVTGVRVEDPFIRLPHQLLNFVRFCELLLRRCENLQSIVLITGQDQNASQRTVQENGLGDLSNSLKARNVKFDVTYSQTMHDREIRFNSGWIVKLGRGLDYFKPSPKYAVGSCDFDLRQCHETIIDILHGSTTPKES